jgi:ribose transport system substrate-binding protein
MLAQGAEVLIVAPLNADGLEPAFQAAADENVPVFLIDREVTAKPCESYITFMGSNFVRQGQQAADLLAEATNEKAQVAILEGTPGASVTTDRQNGFVDQLKAEYPDMEVVASQTANFMQDRGADGHGAAPPVPTPTSPPSTRTTTRWRWVLSRR